MSNATGDTVVQVAEPQDLIRLNIKTLGERVLKVDCPSSANISQLKELIQAQTDLIPARQRLIFRGRQLQNDSTINSNGIENNSFVHLVARPLSAVAVSESTNQSVLHPATISTGSVQHTEHEQPTEHEQSTRRLISRNDMDTLSGPIELSQLLSFASTLRRAHDILGMRVYSSLGDAVFPLDPDGMRFDAGPSADVTLPIHWRRFTPAERCPGPAYESNTGADVYATMRDRVVAADAAEAVEGAWGRVGHGRDSYLYYTHDRENANSRSWADSLRPFEPLWQSLMTVETIAGATGWTKRSTFVPTHVPEQSECLQPTGWTESKSHEGRSVSNVTRFLSKHPSSRGYHCRYTAYMPDSAPPTRIFYVGQWVDVCDTVNKWLEATIMQVIDDKIFVHYNGWPGRWDEWIPADSPRIAPFRSRTTHALVSRSCPVPVTLTQEPKLPHHLHNLQAFVPQLVPYSATVSQLLGDFADLIQEPAKSSDTSKHKDGRSTKPDTTDLPLSDQLGELPASVIGTPLTSGRDTESDLDDLGQSPQRIEGTIEFENAQTSGNRASTVGTAAHYMGPTPTHTTNANRRTPSPSPVPNGIAQQRRRMAQQLAPMLDRIGRIYIDLAAHVQNYGSNCVADDTMEAARAHRALAIAFSRMVQSVRNPNGDGGAHQTERRSNEVPNFSRVASFRSTDSRPSTASSFFRDSVFAPAESTDLAESEEFIQQHLGREAVRRTPMDTSSSTMDAGRNSTQSIGNTTYIGHNVHTARKAKSNKELRDILGLSRLETECKNMNTRHAIPQRAGDAVQDALRYGFLDTVNCPQPSLADVRQVVGCGTGVGVYLPSARSGTNRVFANTIDQICTGNRAWFGSHSNSLLSPGGSTINIDFSLQNTYLCGGPAFDTSASGAAQAEDHAAVDDERILNTTSPLYTQVPSRTRLWQRSQVIEPPALDTIWMGVVMMNSSVRGQRDGRVSEMSDRVSTASTATIDRNISSAGLDLQYRGSTPLPSSIRPTTSASYQSALSGHDDDENHISRTFNNLLSRGIVQASRESSRSEQSSSQSQSANTSSTTTLTTQQSHIEQSTEEEGIPVSMQTEPIDALLERVRALRASARNQLASLNTNTTSAPPQIQRISTPTYNSQGINPQVSLGVVSSRSPLDTQRQPSSSSTTRGAASTVRTSRNDSQTFLRRNADEMSATSGGLNQQTPGAFNQQANQQTPGAFNPQTNHHTSGALNQQTSGALNQQTPGAFNQHTNQQTSALLNQQTPERNRSRLANAGLASLSPNSSTSSPGSRQFATQQSLGSSHALESLLMTSRMPSSTLSVSPLRSTQTTQSNSASSESTTVTMSQTSDTQTSGSQNSAAELHRLESELVRLRRVREEQQHTYEQLRQQRSAQLQRQAELEQRRERATNLANSLNAERSNLMSRYQNLQQRVDALTTTLDGLQAETNNISRQSRVPPSSQDPSQADDDQLSPIVEPTRQPNGVPLANLDDSELSDIPSTPARNDPSRDYPPADEPGPGGST